jgi:hypothetical protein
MGGSSQLSVGPARCLCLLLWLAVGCATAPTTPSTTSRVPELRVGLFVDGGMDRPASRFVLYDTGQVIFERTSPQHLEEYFSVALSASEVQQLLADLKLEEFAKLSVSYGSDDTSPTYFIMVLGPRQESLSATFFQGPLSEQGHFCERNCRAPVAFVRIYERVAFYSHPREQPWFPEDVTVHVSKALPGQSCPWPKEWEDLTSEGSVRMPSHDGNDEEVGTIRARGWRFLDIQRFLADCRERMDNPRVLLRGETVRLSLGNIKLPHQVR